MNPFIIKPILAAMCLLLVTSSLHAWQDEAESANNQDPNSSRPFQVDPDSSSAPTDATDLELQITQLRKELQSLDGDSRSDILDTDPMAVRNIVERIFDTRQQMQRLEAKKMRLKLQLIEANLDARERSRDTIIDQRFKKLVHRQDEPATTQQPQGSVDDAVTSTAVGSVGTSMPPAPRNAISGTAIGTPGDNVQSPDSKFTREYPVDQFSGARSGIGQWNETLLIRKSLAERLADTKTFERQVDDIRLRLANYKMPLSEWNEADKQDYSKFVQALRTRFTTGTTKYDVDLQSVRDANYDRYLREGIVSRSFFGENSPMSATTDKMLDGIRLDLVRELEIRLAADHERLEQALTEWKETWNAYQSRMRLLKLNVEEAKAFQVSLQEKVRTLELFAREDDESNSSFLVTQFADLNTQLPLAKINLKRAEEMLKLYADIETREPDLNPDSLDPDAFKAEK